MVNCWVICTPDSFVRMHVKVWSVDPWRNVYVEDDSSSFPLASYHIVDVT